MNLIFFGSDDFAAIHLEYLIERGYKIPVCVTHPDRQKGRGMKDFASPVKECALRHKIPVLQPSNLRESSLIEELKAYNVQLFIVIAYGQILSSSFLKIPRACALNVHASLLPKYRGAAPINWAIINGERETGLSIIRMTPALDAGDILAEETIAITPQMTAVELRAKMMAIGPGMLDRAIQLIEDKKAKFIAQDKTKVTYAPKLTKEMGAIDWKKGAKNIHGLVRGLLPWPSAYTHYQGKILKILSSEVVGEGARQEPGTLIELTKNGFVIATSDKGLLVKKVHLQASKPMDASSFVNGHRLQVGFNFRV